MDHQNEVPVGSDDLPLGSDNEVPVGPRLAAVLSKPPRRPAVKSSKEEETEAVVARRREPEPLLPQALPLTASVS